MKNVLSILLVAITVVVLTSCNRGQVAIEKLDSIVTNFELQYNQISEDQLVIIKTDYAKAVTEISKYRYTQADNERIGSIKARYDKTLLKYEVLQAKRDAGEWFDRVVGYGKELMDSYSKDSL